MPSLTAVLDPHVIDLKTRIVADFFVNPFLECSREALALRQAQPVEQIDAAVADLIRCGALIDRDGLVVFEPAGDLYEDLRHLAAIHRREDADARHEIRQLESLSRMQEALAVQRDEVVAILDVVPVGVLLLDRYGSLLKANAVARSLLSLETSGGLGDTVCETLGLDLHVVQTSEATAELELGCPLEVTAGPFKAQGSEAGVVVIVKDVSERKALEIEAERTRDEFFSMIRHELRRPLVTIERFLARPSQDELLSHARSSAGHLGGMLDDLLFLARLDHDPLAIHPEDLIRIDNLLTGCELAFRDRAGEKRIALRRDCTAVGVEAKGDERRLQQSVSNLVDNAIKFTPPDGCVVLGCVSTHGGVAIRIDDSGPGIPESERVRVLERFYQIRQGDDRVGGLGVGLSICSGVVEAHGGRLVIEKSPLGGARMEIQIPLEG